MAPLPVSNTARYKVFYTVSGRQHVQEWRSSSSPSVMEVFLDTLWTDVGSLIYQATIDDLQFAGSGSNVFNTVPSTFVGNTYGSGSGTTGEAPYFLSFIGRSADGRRVREYFFGSKLLGGDYRYVSGENTDIDAAIETLVANASILKTISGQQPVWKSYANAGVNAYWQRKVRP